MPGAPQSRQPTEVPTIMRALEAEVFDAVWAAVEPLIPPPDQSCERSLKVAICDQ